MIQQFGQIGAGEPGGRRRVIIAAGIYLLTG
jgi:hypothetical protein